MQDFDQEMTATETITPEPQPVQKVRRVGTFTMGCVMILVGVAILSYSFFGIGNLMLFAKLAPVVLVALGLEVLIASFGHTTKLKYDVFGVIVSTFVVCGVMVAAIGYQWFYMQEPQRWQAEKLATDYISERIYRSVNKEGIENVTVDVAQPTLHAETGDIQSIIRNSMVYLNVTFQSEYAQPHAMAEKVYEINQVIKTEFGELGLNSFRVSYHAENDETQEELFLYTEGIYAFDQDVPHLEQSVEQIQRGGRDEEVLMDEFDVEIQNYKQQIEDMQQQWDAEKAEYEQQIQDLKAQINQGE